MSGLLDQRARDLAANDLATTYLVEAAAGTGKTTLLVRRILTAIKAGVRLPEIAAITFTEKAAGELKERLRKELDDASLADLERAQISTIHSFCAWLLKERPVEAGVDPQFQVTDALQADLLREEAWADWFAREATKTPEERSPLRRLLAVGVTPEQLWTLATLVVESRNKTGTQPGKAGSLAQIAKLVGEIETLRAKANGSDKFAEAIEDWAERLAQCEDAEPWEREALVLTAPPLTTDLKGQKWKPHELFGEAKKLGELIEQRRGELADALLRDALVWLHGFVEHYDKVKRDRVLLDFDDLLLKTCDLLKQHADVREELQRRFRHILVDEFQDTDPVQVEIVEMLDGGAPGKLFLVGDPKQSIYAFRGADIELYQAVAAKKNKLTIQTNFRSRSTLLDWVNEVLAPVLFRSDFQPDYVALEAAPKNKVSEPSVWRLLPASQEEKKSDARSLEAEAIAKCLRRIHDDGRKWSDMAVLFCTTTAQEMFLGALRRFEAPYRVIGGKDFYVRQEIQTLASLLCCLDNPADKLSLVAVLRSPLFGWTDDELVTRHCEYPALLRELHERRHEFSVAGFVEEAMSATKMCEAFATKPDGDACVLNLLKALDLARALEAAGLTSLRAFARRLRRSVLDEFEEEPSPSTEEGDDVVRVMTVHKAKGLEFPVVVMADLCGESRDKGVSLLSSELRFGRLATAGFSAANARQAQCEEAEEIRLLYVAATRAKELLVLPWFVPEKKPGRSRHLEPGLKNVPAKLMRDVNVAELDAEPTALPPLQVELDAKAKGAKEIARRREWLAARKDLIERASQPVARVSPSKLGGEAEPREEEPSGAVRAAAMELGVAVHAALERGDASGLEGKARTMVERALKSELLRRAAKADEAHREVPFSVMTDGGLMEGKIDLLFREGVRWTLVDYKTDAEAHPELYRNQMEAYVDAVERTTGIHMSETLLFFVARNEVVKL
jgi:ATP-dependent helicase/nuclease subunit A